MLVLVLSASLAFLSGAGTDFVRWVKRPSKRGAAFLANLFAGFANKIWVGLSLTLSASKALSESEEGKRGAPKTRGAHPN
jgi:hypothetical protein